MSWSLSNQLMYMIDSTTQQIDVFDYEIETGNVFNRRPFVRIDIGDGLPDGMTIDCEGGVWVCLFGGGALRRYSALGELDFVAKLPVTNPTSLAFGGADLGDLFITTARHRLNEEQLSSEPLAGAILQMRPGIKGLSGQMFAG
jgi:sugar lactone lactonase YvrE